VVGPRAGSHARQTGRQSDTVFINAAECEPLLHKDKEVLRTTSTTSWKAPPSAWLVGANAGHRHQGKYTDVIDLLRRSCRATSTWLAPRRYPAGDEFVLVYDVLGG